MPTPTKRARILLWKGEDHIFYTDHTTGKAHRVNCRANGWTTQKKKRKALQDYREKEMLAEAERATRGGMLAYDTPLVTALTEFLERNELRAKAKEENPDAPNGIARSTADDIAYTIGQFQSWLKKTRKAKLTTGSLDPDLLESFLNFLATSKTRWGNRLDVKRSRSTLNKHRQNIRTALNWINTKRPARFPDFDIFRPVLRSKPAQRSQPKSIPPEDLTSFLASAWRRENPERTITVTRIRNGEEKQYTMPVRSNPSTPVSRLFLLLALTGCRLEEALSLRWEHVDLVRGFVTFYRVKKTAQTRTVPLIGAKEGEVSPGLFELLKLWRKEDSQRKFVLPHHGTDQPANPKSSWQAVYETSKRARIGAQMLRRNFSSYAASMNVPASVAAMWQGHSADVAQDHYRAQVLNRRSGDSMEEAMGLTPYLKKIAAVLEKGASWDSVLYR